MKHTRFVGLDVHKDQISVAVAESGRGGALEYLGQISNDPAAISKLCARLADLFPGSDQARLLGLDRASDPTLWAHAREHGFALVTQDADFAEMAALYGPPPKVIWLRAGNQPTAAVEDTLRRNQLLIHDFDRDPEAACLEHVAQAARIASALARPADAGPRSARPAAAARASGA